MTNDGQRSTVYLYRSTIKILVDTPEITGTTTRIKAITSQPSLTLQCLYPVFPRSTGVLINDVMPMMILQKTDFYSSPPVFKGLDYKEVDGVILLFSGSFSTNYDSLLNGIVTSFSDRTDDIKSAGCFELQP